MPRWTRLTDVRCNGIGAMGNLVDLSATGDYADPDTKDVQYLMLATENTRSVPHFGTLVGPRSSIIDYMRSHIHNAVYDGHEFRWVLAMGLGLGPAEYLTLDSRKKLADAIVLWQANNIDG